MGWSGGIFSRIHNWVSDRDADIKILASRHDAEDDNLANGINNTLTKDGQNAPTANLPMGGFRHTNVGNGTERNHYPAVGQVQDSAFILLTSVSTTGAAITASTTPSLTAYAAGQVFFAIMDSDVDASATLNIDALGAKNVFYDSAAADRFTLFAGDPVLFFYDGTQFHVTILSRNATQRSAVQSTPGSVSYDFNDIPPWANKITITCVALSLTGTNNIQFQIGDEDGGIEGAGYTFTNVELTDSAAVSVQNSSNGTGFNLLNLSAGRVWSGLATLTRQTDDGTRWACTIILGDRVGLNLQVLAGYKTLSGHLDKIRVRAHNTDTFDSVFLGLVWE